METGKPIQDELNPAEKERILSFAMDYYMKEGFYKTPMDTLAAELRISKKTIYKYFPSKEVLVGEVVEKIMSDMNGMTDYIVSREIDAVTKVVMIHELFTKTLLRFSEKWLTDMRLHIPDLWRKIDEFRTHKMFTILSSIFEQGKKEGLFRDKPNEILVTLFTASLRAIINPEFLYFNKFSYNEAVSITFDILFNGVLTKEGEKTYKRKSKEKKDENYY